MDEVLIIALCLNLLILSVQQYNTNRRLELLEKLPSIKDFLKHVKKNRK